MGDSDVYANLSRILETHTFGDEDDDFDTFVNRVTTKGGNNSLNNTDIMNNISSTMNDNTNNMTKDDNYGDPASSSSMNYNNNNNNSNNIPNTRMTPFEAWQKKQNLKSPPVNLYNKNKNSNSDTVSSRRWDELVDHLYKGQSMRQMKDKELNTNLAEELGNLDFRPKMNTYSLQLSRTMKPLMDRIPQMIKKREEMMDKKKQELKKDEEAECTFMPTRQASKASDKYLKKIGRDAQVTPDDLFKFEEEKQRRISDRRKIVRELEEKEFTFKPKLNANSIKLIEDLDMKEQAITNSTVSTDPFDQSTLVTKLLRQKNILAPISRVGEANSRVVAGKILVLQSKHPYEHNLTEYTPICVTGALAYSVMFDPKTETENIYDYIKFYQDDGHTTQWGNGKYCGGLDDSPSNFPGLKGKAALIVPSSRFVVHFKTNNKVNGWGYKMYITPYFGKLNEKYGDPTHTTAFHEGSNHDVTTNGSVTVTTSTGASNNKFTQGSSKLSYQYLKNEEHARRGKPTIHSRAANYQSDKAGKDVHERLYEEGKKSQLDKHNILADQMHRTMALEYRPWEIRRENNQKHSWTMYNAQSSKKVINIRDYITSAINESDKIEFKTQDFHEKFADMWDSLVSAEIDMDNLNYNTNQDNL